MMCVGPSFSCRNRQGGLICGRCVNPSQDEGFLWGLGSYCIHTPRAAAYPLNFAASGPKAGHGVCRVCFQLPQMPGGSDLRLALRYGGAHGWRALPPPPITAIPALAFQPLMQTHILHAH